MIALSRHSIFTVVIAFLLSIPSVAAEPAGGGRGPFGLMWSMSADEVRKAGVQLGAVSDNSNYGKSFTATGLSKVLSDVQSVVLSFGYNDKLWRVAAVGRPMGPDPSGSEIVARYEELASVLSDRYGHGIETDVRDHEIWKETTQYVMSLREGRSFRYTVFHSSTLDVELSIRAEDGDHAFYLILFEYAPGAGEFKKDKKNHEKDAL
jgi:hypothetical protein